MRTGITTLSALLGAVLLLAAAPLAVAAPVQPAPLHQQSERILGKVEFRDRMVAALESMTPPLKVKVVSEDELVATRPDDTELQLYLGNAYQQYLNDPAGLDTLLGNFSRLAAGAGTNDVLKAADLRVLVRPQSYLDFLRDAAERADKPFTLDDQPLQRRLSGGLLALVAQDHAEAYSYPLRDELRAVVPDDAVSWETALANTRANLGDILTEEAAEGILIVTTSNGFGVSLLLFDEVWGRKELKGKGAPVVAVVDRDTLLLTHDGDPDNVAALRRFVESLADDPDSQLLTTALLVRREPNGWVVLGR